MAVQPPSPSTTLTITHEADVTYQPAYTAVLQHIPLAVIVKLVLQYFASAYFLLPRGTLRPSLEVSIENANGCHPGMKQNPDRLICTYPAERLSIEQMFTMLASRSAQMLAPQPARISFIACRNLQADAPLYRNLDGTYTGCYGDVLYCLENGSSLGKKGSCSIFYLNDRNKEPTVIPIPACFSGRRGISHTNAEWDYQQFMAARSDGRVWVIKESGTYYNFNTGLKNIHLLRQIRKDCIVIVGQGEVDKQPAHIMIWNPLTNTETRRLPLDVVQWQGVMYDPRSVFDACVVSDTVVILHDFSILHLFSVPELNSKPCAVSPFSPTVNSVTSGVDGTYLAVTGEHCTTFDSTKEPATPIHHYPEEYHLVTANAAAEPRTSFKLSPVASQGFLSGHQFIVATPNKTLALFDFNNPQWVDTKVKK